MKTTLLVLSGSVALLVSGCHRHYHARSAGHGSCACEGGHGGGCSAHGMKGHGVKGHGMKGHGAHGMKGHGMKGHGMKGHGAHGMKGHRGHGMKGHGGHGMKGHGHHGMKGHGHHGSAGPIHDLPPVLIAYHDSFASAWHPHAEGATAEAVCQVVPVLRIHGDALAKISPPAAGDKKAWSAAATDLQAKTVAVEKACSASGDVGAALEGAKKAFHQLAIAAGAAAAAP